jgi:hypothetical protein
LWTIFLCCYCIKVFRCWGEKEALAFAPFFPFLTNHCSCDTESKSIYIEAVGLLCIIIIITCGGGGGGGYGYGYGWAM